MAVLPSPGYFPLYPTVKFGIFLPRFVVQASLSAQSRSANPFRKNSLRPKLLRTSHPLPPERTLCDSAPPVELNEFTHTPEHLSGVEAEQKFHDSSNSQVSEASVIPNNGGISDVIERFHAALPIPKHALYTVLILADICFAVLLLLRDHKNNSEIKGTDLDGAGNSKPLMSSDEVKAADFNGVGNKEPLIWKNAEKSKIRESTDVVKMDESEVEERISQIREMAREVRRNEREVKGDTSVSPSDKTIDGVMITSASGRRSHVEKEIDEELGIMQERLRYLGSQSLVSLNSCLSNPHCENDMKVDNVNKEKDRLDHADRTGKNQNESAGIPQISNDSGKIKHVEVVRAKDAYWKNRMEIGSIHDTRHDKISTEVMKMRNSHVMKQEISRNNMREKPISALTNKESSVRIDMQDKNAYGGEASSSMPVSERPFPNDIWWLELDYVVVIHMTTGYDSKAQGLFRFSPDPKIYNQIDAPYILAFEDRADASNFCYILWTFFHELKDFNANSIVMFIEELQEASVLHSAKVFVVRKGQLKLYAGQPYSEVERLLCSLILQKRS